ncbi:MAG TPA: anthranilate synthase component I family protein, partial [Polyangiales bacterium]|nr:anthranilate synthase component I family protein [Polyangiales bacterium]
SAPALAARVCDAPELAWLDGEAPHADGRWSFLGCEPVERIERYGGQRSPLAAFDALAAMSGEGGRDADGDDHERLGAYRQLGLDPASVPRWIGYVAYDAAWCDRPGRLVRSGERPVLSFARYDALLAIDHHAGRAYLIGDDEAACVRLARRLRAGSRSPHARSGPIEAAPPELHRAAIFAALERIACGDVYQVNLARCFRAPFDGDPLALWLGLRSASPVPFGFYFDDGRQVIAARTMERFLRWQRATGSLVTRPIKGTLRRSGQRDAGEADLLRADEKERAEHAMIVDLMRNDLGRVARIGSVSVPEVLAVEPYAGLHHLVSTVHCHTRPGVSLRDVLEAAFPPGSVTGTPKLAAIDLIERLEPEPRDVYTGALGFIDRSGGLSLAVAIRCAQIASGEARYFSGGGIVEASHPDRELAETELKAQVFRQAIATLS